MNRPSMIWAILFCIIITGCARAVEEKQVVARINDYVITKDKFEAEFKESIYGQKDTPEARQEFLDNLINRKLILQDAQAKGLDKQQEFLDTIEKFWEQSLLKAALDQKAKEISGSIALSGAEISQYYEVMRAEGKIDKPYEEARQQVKRELLRLKESQAMNDWVARLDKQAKIKINRDLLSSK